MKFAQVSLIDINDSTNILASAETLRELAAIAGKSYTRLRQISSAGKGMLRIGSTWARLETARNASSKVNRK